MFCMWDLSSYPCPYHTSSHFTVCHIKSCHATVLPWHCNKKAGRPDYFTLCVLSIEFKWITKRTAIYQKKNLTKNVEYHLQCQGDLKNSWIIHPSPKVSRPGQKTKKLNTTNPKTAFRQSILDLVTGLRPTFNLGLDSESLSLPLSGRWCNDRAPIFFYIYTVCPSIT